MLRHFFLSLLYIASSGIATAQITPKEGRTLNYRIVGFSFPAQKPAVHYTLQIARGNYTSTDDFQKNISSNVDCKSNRQIAEVPLFGSQYTWRIVSKTGNGKAIASELHHFSTGTAPVTDANNIRLRIAKSAETYKDAYVFFDGSRGMYDMQGNLVWYLPDMNGINDNNIPLADVKLTPKGTLTLLLNRQGYEINYDGKILWQAPNDGKVNGDSIERYHHEFTMLSNGNYMMLGSETAEGYMEKDKTKQQLVPKIPLGTLIEYNKKGEVLWQWKGSTYYPTSDYEFFRPPHADMAPKGTMDPHENGFFFDEKTKNIYVSCKNISRILKIKYPEGKVVNAYGKNYANSTAQPEDNFFCHQHSPRISQKGYLYLFNNATCDLVANTPKIEVLQEPASGKGPLKKVWEYDFGEERGYTNELSGGGNVYELPDQSVFVCMGHQYGEALIISQDKKILWRAIPEKRKENSSEWEYIPEYRASIITDRKDFEKLIWSSLQQ